MHRGYPDPGDAVRLEEAIAHCIDLACDVAVCGVDNNPARVAANRYFRSQQMPVIFVAVSRDADHGYVFVQEKAGPCIACAVDTLTMKRPRSWNYRRGCLSDGSLDGAACIAALGLRYV
jgi:hypothetical protein